jgi:putative glutamine amidotransferase
MQEMFNEDNLIDIKNHYINNLHEVIILKNTLLHNIIKKEKILVNSRHNSSIKNTEYTINAKSKDKIIEALELKNHKFYLGLQWHPENLYDIDSNSKKIFDYFIKICKN